MVDNTADGGSAGATGTGRLADGDTNSLAKDTLAKDTLAKDTLARNARRLDPTRSAAAVFAESRRMIALAEAFIARSDFRAAVTLLAELDDERLFGLARDGFTTYLIAQEVAVPSEISVHLTIGETTTDSLLDTRLSVCVHSVDAGGHPHEYGVHLTVFGWLPGCAC